MSGAGDRPNGMNLAGQPSNERHYQIYPKVQSESHPPIGSRWWQKDGHRSLEDELTSAILYESPPFLVFGY